MGLLALSRIFTLACLFLFQQFSTAILEFLFYFVGVILDSKNLPDNILLLYGGLAMVLDSISWEISPLPIDFPIN